MRPKDIEEGKIIGDAIRSFSLKHEELPGVSSPQNLSALVEQLVESNRRVRYLEHLAARSNDKCCNNPASIGFDPFKGAVEAKRAKELDEACWLIFLATNFGKTRRNGWLVVARIYGALRNSPYWTWKRISVAPQQFFAVVHGQHG